MRKRIGVLMNQSGDKVNINFAYLNYFQQFGEIVHIAPYYTSKELLKSLDLFCGIGGLDVCPIRYGQPPISSSQMCEEFEYFDMKFIPFMLNQKIPMFGICRFMQTLSVAMGGSMEQDISYTGHKTSTGRGDEAHRVIGVYPNGDLNRNISFGVNSLHHQKINKLGDGLRIDTIALDKNGKAHPPHETIESYVGIDSPIFAVEWHPEEMFSHDTCKEAQAYCVAGINKLLHP
jgi:gamma-glutamyl-gamma-aminobutyrate hydrolase PuuD